MRLPKVAEVQYASLNIVCGHEEGGLYRSGICEWEDGHALFYTVEMGELTICSLYLIPPDKLEQVKKRFIED